ncbi:MAG TPA: serine/threonine-protein kinase [Gemmataceae bacterium]|nr:serine/threonine-protein kinase [Gemmataceae bacterium]
MSAPAADLKSIFGKALDICSPAERAAYLDAACGDNLALRQEIESLLRADQQARGFLEELVPLPAETMDAMIVERPGTVIGPYKLMEQIGEGGMGLVFVAEQQQPVRRKVALKVIKPGMDTRQVIARFEAERQALALMDHPNIARVYDGGQTASGRPYFVMELVKGVPMTEYCDQNQIPIRERLALFLHVCQAVQHAHQKGIIHRDLKPSNVLVMSNDGTPLVKVIDFGIAKAIGQQLTDKTIYTQFTQLVGTPLYMSPEQAGQSGADIDTRTDIYSLGVLLYELLTGTTPFDGERFKEAGYDELRRIIREEEPPKPSTRLSTLGQMATTISTQRKSGPKQLSRLFRGELDWIVMTALEKDRNRRYESASAFAADVQRYLRDEPVQACPPSAWYRFRKFARRNKAMLVTTLLIAAALVTVAAGLGWVAHDRKTRRDEVAKAIQDDLRESVAWQGQGRLPEAITAARRATELLAGADVDPALVHQVQARLDDLELVDRLQQIRLQRGAEVTNGHFDAEGPDRLYEQTFRAAGFDIEALPAQIAAARIQASSVPIELAAALDDWAQARRDSRSKKDASWKSFVQVACLVDSDPWRTRARQALIAGDRAALRRLVASVDVAHLPASTLSALAYALWRDKVADSTAEAFLRSAQSQHPSDFWLNETLVLFYRQQPQPSRSAEEIRFATVAVGLRPDSPGTHLNLGLALFDAGRSDEAITEYRHAIRLQDHYAEAHNNLGVAFGAKGQLDQAIEEFQHAIRLRKGFAIAHCNLGHTFRKKGRLDDAVAEYREAIRFKKDYLEAHGSLGDLLRNKGALAEAITECREAVRIKTNSVGAHYNLGLALHEASRLDEAIGEYRETIRLNPNFAEAHCNLASALMVQGKFQQAASEYRRGHELGSGKPGWAYPSAGWLARAETMARLDDRLADYLAGRAKPRDPSEELNLAWLCQQPFKALYAASVRWYSHAFSVQPKLADDLEAQHRYSAACAAALAGLGKGKDTGKLSPAERARLRRQALAWLRSDLAANRHALDHAPAKAAPVIAQRLQHWLQDEDLAGVRTRQALGQLPQAERHDWQKLWQEVETLLRRAAGRPTAPAASR